MQTPHRGTQAPLAVTRRLHSTRAQELRSTRLAVVCGISVPQPEMEPGLLALGVQSLNHRTTREVPRIHFCLLGMKAECPAQKEQQRQETPDSRTGRGIRARGRQHQEHGGGGAALLQTHVTSTHCVHCTYILGNSSFDHTSHINLREDSIQALRWTRPKTSLSIASTIKLSCSDWNTMEKDLAEVKKNVFN